MGGGSWFGPRERLWFKMFQIPWLGLAYSFVILATQPLWLQWLLWFFTSSIMTATLVGFRLLLQAPVSHHGAPPPPPPPKQTK